MSTPKIDWCFSLIIKKLSSGAHGNSQKILNPNFDTWGPEYGSNLKVNWIKKVSVPTKT